jgi:sec-independent protein translocase protein TatB
MMPGVGFEEMILLVLVAIIVIGPKDLPLMMRKFGRFTGKMRAMAFEFKQGFDELGRQAELEELRKEVADLKNMTGIDDLRRGFEEDKRALEADVNSALAEPEPPKPAALASPGQPSAGTELTTPATPPPVTASAAPVAAVTAAAATADPEFVPAMTVRSADKFPKPIKRTPTHPAAASAVSVARPDPAPYAGLSADHPGYDTGEDFRLEGHPPETFTAANGEAANGVDDDHVHIIPDDEVRPPAPAPMPVKQDTTA